MCSVTIGAILIPLTTPEAASTAGVCRRKGLQSGGASANFHRGQASRNVISRSLYELISNFSHGADRETCNVQPIFLRPSSPHRPNDRNSADACTSRPRGVPRRPERPARPSPHLLLVDLHHGALDVHQHVGLRFFLALDVLKEERDGARNEAQLLGVGVQLSLGGGGPLGAVSEALHRVRFACKSWVSEAAI
jgi:hypothetical protein